MKRKRPEPMHYASCYSLDLYCDHENPAHPFESFPHTFTGETFGECARQARRKGWVIHKDRTATCPLCNGSRGAKERKPEERESWWVGHMMRSREPVR